MVQSIGQIISLILYKSTWFNPRAPSSTPSSTPSSCVFVCVCCVYVRFQYVGTFVSRGKDSTKYVIPTLHPSSRRILLISLFLPTNSTELYFGRMLIFWMVDFLIPSSFTLSLSLSLFLLLLQGEDVSATYTTPPHWPAPAMRQRQQ